MLAFVGETIASLVIVYVINLKLRVYSFKLKEASAVAIVVVSFGLLIYLLNQGFATSAVLSNISFVIALTIAVYIQTRQFASSAFYAMFSVIIILFSSSILSAGLSLAHLLMPGLPIGREAVTGSIHYLIVFTASVFIVSVLISFRLGLYMKKMTTGYDSILRKKLFTYLMYGAVITLATFFVNTFLRYIIDDEAIQTLLYTSTMAAGFAYLVFAIMTLANNLRMELELSHKDERMADMIAYSAIIESAASDLQQFKHDHANLILGFEGFLDKEDWDGFREYYNRYKSKFAESAKETDAFMVKVDDVQISALKGIILNKSMMAQQRGIKLRLEVGDDVRLENNNDAFELCRIFGILMDNAIEACTDVNDAEVGVLMAKDRDDVLVVIENTCLEEPPMSVMFDKGFSTKGVGRGLGLYNVSQTIARSERMILGTTWAEGVLCQKLRLLGNQRSAKMGG